MTNNKQVSLYDFKGHQVRVVEIDGNPWFVAADVCECLDLHPSPSNGSYQSHYRRLQADELCLATIRQPKANSLRMKMLAESGLYKLVLKSRKPDAKDFQDWVTREVLPSIRKDGMYVKGEEKIDLADVRRWTAGRTS